VTELTSCKSIHKEIKLLCSRLTALEASVTSHQQVVNRAIGAGDQRMNAIEANHVEFSQFVEEVITELKQSVKDRERTNLVLEGLHDWLQTGRHIVRST
jgi:hypothetical protein